MANNNSINASVPLIQTVSTTYATYTSINTVIPYDDTIPQNDEGTELITLAITPSSATSILEIICEIPGASRDDEAMYTIALFQDATANAISAVQNLHQWSTTENSFSSQVLKHIMTSGTTSSTTFKVRIGSDIGALWYINGFWNNRLYGGVQSVILIINEYYV